MSKFAIVSFAAVLLGSSAALAQPYGYRPNVNNGPTPGYCGPQTSQTTNWILDPATGQPITEAQYLARYPSNPANWTYNCNTGLWTDNGPAANPGYYAPQAENNGRDRGRDRRDERGRDNERDDRR